MTKGTILLVEDDAEIADFISKGLRAEGYDITIREEGAGVPETAAQGYHLVILDRMLPDIEGADLCRQIRAGGSEVMILMLTARDALEEKIEGLTAGADDYVTKPFAFTELLARIDVLLRRPASGRGTARDIRYNGLHLDLNRRKASRNGRDLPLTATEFELLLFLARNAGRVVSRTEILKGVWGYDFDPNTNIVEVYIAYLRRKMAQEGSLNPIHNVRGVGYLLSEAEETAGS